MKKRILLAISAMFILALTVAAFALTQSNSSSKPAADSCRMKGINARAADGQTKTSCCDKDDCCCKGDSCPMKSSDENASASCCSCCGDSCPMKNKDAQATSVDMKNVTVATGESCCNGGSCCKGKQS
jgi:hypothetical protein